MNLITETQRAQLLANGRQSIENDDFDPPPVVKLFTPDAGATWLLTEIDPDDHDHAFGLCDLGHGFPELGYVSLAELQSVRGRLGLQVERDLHFTASKPISAYAREARLAYVGPVFIAQTSGGIRDIGLAGVSKAALSSSPKLRAVFATDLCRLGDKD